MPSTQRGYREQLALDGLPARARRRQLDVRREGSLDHFGVRVIGSHVEMLLK
jgi:hypothetical protein